VTVSNPTSPAGGGVSGSLACTVSGWQGAGQAGPSGRTGAAFAYDEQNKRLVLFGGSPNPAAQSYVNDTWTFDGVTWTLAQIACAACTDRPSPRAFAAMAWDAAHGRIVLSGGVGDASPFDDAWFWNGTIWARLPGGLPSGRWAVAMAFDYSLWQFVMHGGSSSPVVGGCHTTLDETYVWDGVSPSAVARSPAVTPGARFGASFACARGFGRCLLYGGLLEVNAGSCAQSTLGTSFWWDGSTWRDAGAVSPPPRAFATLLADSRRNLLYLSGGRSASGASLADTWLFDPSSLLAPLWSQTVFADPSPGREGAAFAFEPQLGRAFLVGGQSVDPLGMRTFLTDVWTFAPSEDESCPLTNASAIGPTTITVPATQGAFTATGITFAPCRQVTFTATGTIGVDTSVCAVGVTADGALGCGSPSVYRYNTGSLIGRIAPDGAPFFIGAARTLSFPYGGPLELLVDDAAPTDNTGAYSVAVTY
jgi:hypothetical protein